MTSPLLVFVCAVGAGAVSLSDLVTELLEQIADHLDDLTDLARLSLVSKSMAQATLDGRNIGRLFRDYRVPDDDLPQLVTSICTDPNVHVRGLLLREVHYDSALCLIDRLLASRAEPESVASALSLLVDVCGPDVIGDVISGVVAPYGGDFDDDVRACQIRVRVQGLDFRHRPSLLPEPVLNQVRFFLRHPIQDEAPLDFAVSAAEQERVRAQYPAEFRDIFLINQGAAEVLLHVPASQAQLGSRPTLLQLLRIGIRFEFTAFLTEVENVPGPVLSQIYPLLDWRPQTRWVPVLAKLIKVNNARAVDALFRIGHFERKLAADPGAADAFLALAVTAVELDRNEIFEVMARNPLMRQTVNESVRGTTLLHEAVKRGRVRIVSILLSFPNVRLDQRDAQRHRPAYYANWPSRIWHMLRNEKEIREMMTNT